MTLRSLTYIVLIPAFVLTFICVWMFFSSHYRKHFEKAEHEHLRKQEMILVSYAEKHLSMLANTTKDWAVWDDTYDFMQTKSGAYTASNLAPTTLESLDIDGMLYLDSGMNLFHSYFSEETAGKARDIASAIRSSRAEIEDHSNRRLNYFFIQTPKTARYSYAHTAE